MYTTNKPSVGAFLDAMEKAVELLPEDCSLFGASGTLLVIHDPLTEAARQTEEGAVVVIASVDGCFCDGGDPQQIEGTELLCSWSPAVWHEEGEDGRCEHCGKDLTCTP